MRYTITRCPNTPEVMAAARQLRLPGWRHRNRGRGFRYARYPGDVQYHQSLPLDKAWYFTVYGEMAPNLDEDGHTIWPFNNEPYTRFRFVKLQKNGRLRVRLLNEEEKAMPQKLTYNHAERQCYCDGELITCISAEVMMLNEDPATDYAFLHLRELDYDMDAVEKVHEEIAAGPAAEGKARPNETQKLYASLKKAGHDSFMIWSIIAQSKLNGLTIETVRYLNKKELEDLGWDESGLAIFFTNGDYIHFSRDDEGNGPGACFTSFEGCPVLPTL